MGTGLASGGLGRWTRYFTVASALSLVAVEVLVALGASRSLVAAVGLFGFVCPMIFGMAYLLLPSYVGRTLIDHRLPGVHFALAYLGAGGLVAGLATGVVDVLRAGSALWGAGVAVFVGSLGWTIVSAVRDRPALLIRSATRPQQSTRLVPLAIVVAVCYLVIGTIALFGRTGLGPLPTASFPAIVHYYGAGFGALLVFALGARLLPEFFHVTPPRSGTWIVLVSGAVAPYVLATSLWGGVAFRVGGVVQFVAMTGYAAVVGDVVRRSNRRRPGLYGILLGALLGVVAVGVNLPAAFGGVFPGQLRAHALGVVTGFFALTITGYAVQFFGLTGGRFRGASTRVVYAMLAMLASGTGLSVVGLGIAVPPIVWSGSVLGLGGATTYAYLVCRRLLAV
jgi:hypothetical protein